MTESVEVDRDAVRAALEAAYQDHAEKDPNALELFVYANDLPADTPESVATEIAADVLTDPPIIETDETGGFGWFEADFSDVKTGFYAPELTEHNGWMTHFGDKLPYAPWSDPNDPAPCSKHDTTADGCDCDARYKWGWEPNRRPFDKAQLALDDDRFEGLVYIQTEADPFVFVDGDDVRCPETGDVHPAFLALLEHFGMTYADVSTSGTGVHAYYRGDLPADETVAKWDLDTEAWGENDDKPAIEIYSGKHVNVTTGEHVAGTPLEARRWNGETVHAIVDANDEVDMWSAYGSERDEAGDEDTDTGDESDSGTSDHIKALGRLNAKRVAEKTIVDEWTASRSKSLRSFLPTWGSSDDGGTANFVDRECWVDTGSNDAAGGPIEMALIDLGNLRPGNSEVGKATGSDFWTGYEHLRDLGFTSLPEPPHVDESADEGVSDYYNTDLSSYVDGDPWSDPDAMLEACLKARADGVIEGDADPPTLALHPIVRDLLGVDHVDGATKDGALDIYHDELTVDDFDGDEILL